MYTTKVPTGDYASFDRQLFYINLNGLQVRINAPVCILNERTQHIYQKHLWIP